MIIKVTGKNETLKEIEEVKKLLDDAGKILYRLQTTIGLTVKTEGDVGENVTAVLDNQ